MNRDLLGVNRLRRRSQRIDKAEELFHMSDFERALDAFVHPDQVQATAIFLMDDVGTRARALAPTLLRRI
jgi:hypothetical protein